MDATAPAAVKVSIKVMKEIIRRAGLSTADLLERHDVEARYAQAEARLAEAERLKNQSKKRGHVAGSSGDDGPMTPEALGKKKSKVATTCVSSGRFSNCASQENVAHEPIDLAGDASDGHRTSDDEDEDDDAAHKRAERLLSECGAYAAKLITELRSAGLASSTRHGALCAGEMVSSNSSTDFVPLDQAEVRRCCGPDLKLRQHQIVGVNWLLLLERVGANGVLADDMGLGKTIQTIAYLAASRARKLAQNPSYQGRDVVVVPASTLGNWQREFARWAPYEKRVVVYHGSMKERHLLRYDQDVTTAHVILTTYTWWEREDCEDDRSFFKHYAPWAHVVLDEGHNLRNPDASRSRHLRRFDETVREHYAVKGLDYEWISGMSTRGYFIEGCLASCWPFRIRSIKDARECSRELGDGGLIGRGLDDLDVRRTFFKYATDWSGRSQAERDALPTPTHNFAGGWVSVVPEDSDQTLGSPADLRWAAERTDDMPENCPVGISLTWGPSSNWRVRISGTHLGCYPSAAQAWAAYPKATADDDSESDDNSITLDQMRENAMLPPAKRHRS